MKKFTVTIITLIVIVCTFGCGAQKDPVEYNNEVITIINGSEKHITEMNTAMVNKNYEEASKVLKDWQKAVNEDISKMEAIGDFNGDRKLQQAVLTGLKGYKKIIEDDYPKLIESRKNNADDIQSEETLLNNINDAFEAMANGVNQASDQFEKEHMSSK